MSYASEQGVLNEQHNAATAAFWAEQERQRPFILLRPPIYPDGDQWCVLLGDDLMTGIAGFGPTPDEASRAFDKAWLTAKTPRALALEKRPTPPSQDQKGGEAMADCKHCRNGFLDNRFGQDVECVNGVLIDIDEFNEGHSPDVVRPVAPCHPMWERQLADPYGDTWENDSIERLDAERLPAPTPDQTNEVTHG